MQWHRRRDAVASSTTNDKEIARNPHTPKGLGRDGPISLLLLLADVWASTRRRASIWSPSRSQHTSSYLWQGVLSTGPGQGVQESPATLF